MAHSTHNVFHLPSQQVDLHGYPAPPLPRPMNPMPTQQYYPPAATGQWAAPPSPPSWEVDPLGQHLDHLRSLFDRFQNVLHPACYGKLRQAVGGALGAEPLREAVNPAVWIPYDQQVGAFLRQVQHCNLFAPAPRERIYHTLMGWMMHQP